MGTFYVLLYRMYFILKKSAEGMLRRSPGTRRGLDPLIVSGWSSAISSERRTLGCGFNPAYPRGCGCRFMFPEKRASGVESMNPTYRMQFWLRVRPGAVVYDVGAHVGTMTLGAAQLVGDLGRVVAFDGDPENVERLRGNSARNGLEGHLQLVHTAVWSRTASDGISFRRGTTARSHGSVEADGNRPVWRGVKP